MAHRPLRVWNPGPIWGGGLIGGGVAGGYEAFGPNIPGFLGDAAKILDSNIYLWLPFLILSTGFGALVGGIFSQKRIL